jgi:hypothetical protein
MAKRRYIQNDNNGNDDANAMAARRVVSVNQKLICHVFESDEVCRKILYRFDLSCLFRLNLLLIPLDKLFK